MRRRAFWWGTLLVGVALAAGSLHPVLAQSSSGAVGGVVLDESGAVVPGVMVTLTSLDTGAVRTQVSGASGGFKFPLLPVGRYSVATSLQGFAPSRLDGIDVTVGGDISVKVTMRLATVSEEMVVRGEAPLIETTRSQSSSVVSEAMIENLPVNGRSFIDFVLTTPGVTKDVRLGDISFAGQRGTLNSLVVDGADNNNTFFGQTLGRTGSGRAPYQFSQDAVKEFQVNRNAYSAEYGRAGGAVINVVTKSGTNEYHGTGFFFYRDKSLNQKDYIDQINGRPKAPYHYDQYGASAGGPIVKDKLFFFANYDAQRNEIPNTVVLTVPPGTPTDADTVAGIAKLQPLATSWLRNQNQDVYLLKLDYQMSMDHRFSLRYNKQNFTGKNFENGGITNSSQHTGDSLVGTDTVSWSLASILGPKVFNEVRGQWARDREPGKANSADPEAVIRQSGQQVLLIGRNSFSPRETTIERQQLADAVTLLTGDHSFKAGFDYNRDKILNFFPGNFFGSYTFDSFADFNRGTPASFTQAFPGTGTSGPTTHPDLTDWALFAQDEWKVAPAFTLNLGARYDLQEVKQPTVRNPDAQLTAAGLLTDIIPKDTNNWAVRLGFAWTPKGSDSTVVRGGYGIFYGRTPSIMFGTATSNNGINVQTITFRGGQMPTYPNIFPTLPTGAALPKPTIFVFDPSFQNPKVQQASLGVEHALTGDLAVNATYLYVKGDDLPRSTDINIGAASDVTLPVVGGGTVTYRRYSSTRPFSNFTRIIEFQSSAHSEYNGLTLEIIKRYSHHWMGRMAYTWGAVKDDKPDATAVVPFSAGDDAKYAQDPLDLHGDWAYGDNDARHRLVLSGMWNLDYAAGLESGFLKALLSGWSISGIFTVQTGQPYTAYINSDLNNDGNSRNDRAPGFARNTYSLPTVVTLDPRISRRIPIGPVELEIIAEAFNVLNRSNVNGARNTYYSLNATKDALVYQTNFGTPTSSAGPRIIQLAAKLSF